MTHLRQPKGAGDTKWKATRDEFRPYKTVDGYRGIRVDAREIEMGGLVLTLVGILRCNPVQLSEQTELNCVVKFRPWCQKMDLFSTGLCYHLGLT